MLLGLPSQMGIKVNLDLTQYISFNSSSAAYHLHYVSLTNLAPFSNDSYHMLSENITEFDKSTKSSYLQQFSTIFITHEKINTAYVNSRILYQLCIGVYEHQSKLLREKWQSSTQQNNYKKLNIG